MSRYLERATEIIDECKTERTAPAVAQLCESVRREVIAECEDVARRFAIKSHPVSYTPKFIYTEEENAMFAARKACDAVAEAIRRLGAA